MTRNFFAGDGSLSKSLPRYEYREEQLLMAEAVADAVHHQQVLMVEAGTGVGKSLAYLVPAILHAVRNDKKVFVATGTKTLQHQLMEKELPFLKQYLGTPFKYALCIGSENYLCQRRLEGISILQNKDLFGGEQELEKLKKWAQTTKTGIQADIDFPLSGHTWYQVCRIPELCTGQKCPAEKECFFMQAMNLMTKAQVLVGNHHLLFANLRAEWSYLPKCHLLVVDEAHNLDLVASDCLGIEFSQRALHRMWESLRGIDGRNCFLGSLLEIPIDQRLGVIDQVRTLEMHFIEVMRWFHQEVLRGDPRISVPVETAQLGFEHFIEMLSELVASMKLITKTIDKEEHRTECEGYTTRLIRVLGDAKRIINLTAEDPWLLWCEELQLRSHNHPDGEPTAAFHATPIYPGDILEASLYPAFESSILVSATLTTGGEFDYMQERLGTSAAKTLCLQSPFDYQNNLLVYTPKNIPEPTQFEGYVQEVSEEVAQLVQSVEGGTFVLCTSYKILNTLYDLFRNKVPSVEYTPGKSAYPGSFSSKKKGTRHQVLALRQGDAPRERMLEAFRKAPKAVLFGAITFWQGVDVPGKDLEMVIITRLPFQSPDDPVLETKVRLCRNQGGDPFHTIQVPYAVMQFRQGIGRLIRSKTDRGVVAVLDSRVVTKGYGRTFLKSLPQCRQTDRIEDVREFLKVTQEEEPVPF